MNAEERRNLREERERLEKKLLSLLQNDKKTSQNNTPSVSKAPTPIARLASPSSTLKSSSTVKSLSTPKGFPTVKSSPSPLAKEEREAIPITVSCRIRPVFDPHFRFPNGIPSQQRVQLRCVRSSTEDPTVVYALHDNSQFTFSHVFSENTPQSDVYNKMGKPIVEDVLLGYNGSILVYGQTGSGKTHTVFGPPRIGAQDTEGRDSPAVLDAADPGLGLAARALETIFDAVRTAEAPVKYEVELSLVEIYMERVRDLLADRIPGVSGAKRETGGRPGTGDQRKVREDVLHKTFFVEKCHTPQVRSTEEALSLVMSGLKRRTTASTAMNDTSSRSHCLLSLVVRRSEGLDGEMRVGRLALVDLAGSEKVSRTHSIGMQLEEAKLINKSLSTLSMVIDALTSHSSHVPYRNSVLTMLLKDSLGGNARTSMVVCCAPEGENASETVSTLRFGALARKVVNQSKINIGLPSREELERKLEMAHREIGCLRASLAAARSSEEPVLSAAADDTGENPGGSLSNSLPLKSRVSASIHGSVRDETIENEDDEKIRCLETELGLADEAMINLMMERDSWKMQVEGQNEEIKLWEEEYRSLKNAQASTHAENISLRRSMSSQEKDLLSLIRLLESVWKEVNVAKLHLDAIAAKEAAEPKPNTCTVSPFGSINCTSCGAVNQVLVPDEHFKHLRLLTPSPPISRGSCVTQPLIGRMSGSGRLSSGRGSGRSAPPSGNFTVVDPLPSNFSFRMRNGNFGNTFDLTGRTDASDFWGVLSVSDSTITTAREPPSMRVPYSARQASEENQSTDPSVLAKKNVNTISNGSGSSCPPRRKISSDTRNSSPSTVRSPDVGITPPNSFFPAEEVEFCEELEFKFATASGNKSSYQNVTTSPQTIQSDSITNDSKPQQNLPHLPQLPSIMQVGAGSARENLWDQLFVNTIPTVDLANVTVSSMENGDRESFLTASVQPANEEKQHLLADDPKTNVSMSDGTVSFEGPPCPHRENTLTHLLMSASPEDSTSQNETNLVEMNDTEGFQPAGKDPPPANQSNPSVSIPEHHWEEQVKHLQAHVDLLHDSVEQERKSNESLRVILAGHRRWKQLYDELLAASKNSEAQGKQ